MLRNWIRRQLWENPCKFSTILLVRENNHFQCATSYNSILDKSILFVSLGIECKKQFDLLTVEKKLEIKPEVKPEVEKVAAKQKEELQYVPDSPPPSVPPPVIQCEDSSSSSSSIADDSLETEDHFYNSSGHIGIEGPFNFPSRAFPTPPTDFLEELKDVPAPPPRPAPLQNKWKSSKVIQFYILSTYILYLLVYYIYPYITSTSCSTVRASGKRAQIKEAPPRSACSTPKQIEIFEGNLILYFIYLYIMSTCILYLPIYHIYFLFHGSGFREARSNQRRLLTAFSLENDSEHSRWSQEIQSIVYPSSISTTYS